MALPPTTGSTGVEGLAAEPLIVVQGWTDQLFMDLRSLEAALAAFLAGLDGLNLPRALTPLGTAWPMWLLALALAAAASEMARRQMRRARLALPEGDDRRLAEMLVPPLEEG